MNDPLRKVKSGDLLRIPAGTYNAFVNAAEDFRARQRSQGREAQAGHVSSGIVLVRNNSGSDCDRFGVLGIDGPIINPADNEQAFKNRRALKGVTPAIASHFGKFVICLEPIANGKIGQAMVSGVCVVKVSVQNASDRYADVENGQLLRLKSGPIGAAVILWHETGTGLKWAIVSLGPAVPESDFWAEVQQTPGANDTTLSCKRWYIETGASGGDSFNVECDLYGSTKLSECIPPITAGRKVRVALVGWSGTTPVYRCTSHWFGKKGPC